MSDVPGKKLPLRQAVHSVALTCLMLAGVTLSGASALAQSNTLPPSRDSALILYGYTLFPGYVADHCDSAVVRDNPAMSLAVTRWQVRQEAYLGRVAEIIESTGGLSERTKALSQHMAKSAAERDVEQRADKAAYCREFVARLDSGEFDLDKVAGMSPLLAPLMAMGQQ